MATAVWPDTVPDGPERGSYAEQRIPNGSQFQPRVGPPTQFRTTTLQVSSIRASFSWTTEQRDAFLSFYDDNLDGGVKPFLWTNPAYGVQGRYLFDIQNGPQIQDNGYDRYIVAVNMFKLS